MTKEVVIVSATRTPIGNFQGSLSSLMATQLGSIAIIDALQQASIEPEQIESVIMGCVLPAGLGQAPARQAAMGAWIPSSVGATTINKVCGSSMQALIMAHDAILAGSYESMIAGGMESMSNAPYLLLNAREGYRFGHQNVIDHMMFDGLEDAYEHGKLMGEFAEQCAKKYKLTRAAQDQYALESLEFANAAPFKNEITPIELEDGTDVIEDDGPKSAKPEKVPDLKPAFAKDGTITAANASRISDGAAVLVVMSADRAEQDEATPIARVVAHATHAQDPEWFSTAPIGAIQKVLKKADWNIDDVDLFEVNEAFAVVPMAAMKELNIPRKKMNIHGGAVVLGHPLGATGARIIVTLIHALRAKKLTKGVAALCLGGGEATAVAIELI